MVPVDRPLRSHSFFLFLFLSSFHPGLATAISSLRLFRIAVLSTFACSSSLHRHSSYVSGDFLSSTAGRALRHGHFLGRKSGVRVTPHMWRIAGESLLFWTQNSPKDWYPDAPRLILRRWNLKSMQAGLIFFKGWGLFLKYYSFSLWIRFIIIDFYYVSSKYVTIIAPL